MGMKKKGKKVEKKEEIAEDWCFQCYEGGSLLVCDYKQCLKAYHVDCVRKDESFTETDDPWFCRRHSCYQCKKSSKYQCCGCPNAVCKQCIDNVDFARIKGKALCHHCTKLALLGEEGMDADSDGECVDFKDLETFEGLFYDYWKRVVKEKEGLTLEDLQSADVQIKKGVNYKAGYKTKDSDNEEEFQPIAGSDSADDNDDDDDVDDDNDGDNKIDDVEGLRPKLAQKRKKSNEKKLVMNRGSKSKSEIPKSRKEILSWGSKPLLDFLASMGEDTSKRYEPYKVAYIIHRYADENNLIHKIKPRKIVCDEKLKSLLGRKIVDKNKIVDLLEPHYPEYLESSDEEKEETKCSPGEKEKETTELCKKQKIVITHKKSEEPVRAPQSYFAFVISENIKLIFLKKSLVQELLKDHENFESKVVGSFVRVKLDSGVGSRRYSFQLLQVTGINKTSKEETNSEVLLQVTTFIKDISINLLSDDYFSEEECEDLRKKVKDGLIRRPTIMELELKAKSLHEDITKHWIAKELATLQNRIDHANEKGRRREFFECCERQRLLQTQEEQSRLLRKVPNIIPDLTDDEPMAKNGIVEDEKEKQISLKSKLVESPETPGSIGEENGTSSVPANEEHRAVVSSPGENDYQVEGNIFSECKLLQKIQK